MGTFQATGVPWAAEKAKGESRKSGGDGKLEGEKEQDDREGPVRAGGGGGGGGGGGEVQWPEGRPRKLMLWCSTCEG